MTSQEKKSIVFFCGSLQQGGAESVIVTLSNYWAKQNNKVSIITVDNKQAAYPLEYSINHLKLDLSKESQGNIWRGVSEIYKRVLKLRNILKKTQPNVLISFITDANLIALFATYGLKTKVIVSDRSDPFFDKSYINPTKFLMKKFLYRLSSSVVIQTKGSAVYYKKWLSSKKIFVINNPIQTIFCKEPVVKNTKENIILSVGRLVHEKNFEMLIKSFSKVNQSSWCLVIVGEGKQREMLTQIINEYKMGHCIFLEGSTNNIIDWYKKASIFVLPSRSEGYPNVLIEAMAMGLPVISTSCNYGPSEIIRHGENGLLIKNDNEGELKNALEKLIGDKKLRNGLGKNALLIREQLNIERIALQWEELF